MHSEKTTPYFSKSTYIQLIGAVAVFCLFHDVWFDFFTNKIVEPYLSIIKKYWLKDIAFATLSLGIFILLRRELIAITTRSPEKHLGTNKHFNLFVISVSLYYSIFRFQDLLNYESLACCRKIVYSDIFLLFGLLNFVVLVVDFFFYKNKDENIKTDFFLDNPIEELDDDKLQYKTYAENLALKINESVFSKPFAIGVTSEWGTGKTSFINLVRKNLKPEILQIDFSPWHYNSTEKMLSEFFNLFEQKINENNPFNNELSRLISSYRQQLVAKKESFISKAINTINIFKQEDSLNSLYEKINDKLITLDLNIVVFIDDLDRLNPDEVYEVLRLIRNSGSFKRTCFAVAYDREYVVNALKQLNIYSPRTYLEKLFQIEVTLPYYDKNAVKNLLKIGLVKILESAKNSEIISDYLYQKNKSLVNSNEIFINDNKRKPIVLNWISSFRDVKRLLNALSMNSKNLFMEIDFKEFIHIELLRMRFPKVYSLLHQKRDVFFVENGKMESLSLRFDSSKKILVIEDFLQTNYSVLLIEPTEVNIIKDLLLGLFYSSEDRTRQHLNKINWKVSIENKYVFWAYFSYGIIPEILSNDQFLLLLNKDLSEAKTEVEKILNSPLETQFLNRLKSVSAEELQFDLTRYYKFLEIFIYTESSPSIRIGYDFFYDYVNSDNNFGREFKIKDISTFLKPIFENLDFGLSYKAGFISYVGGLSSKINDEFVVPVFEAEDIEYYLIKYFQKVCEDVSSTTRIVFEYWGNCNIPGIVSHLYPEEIIHSAVYFPKAREIFKTYISEKGLDDFINSITSPDGTLSTKLLMPIFQTKDSSFETMAIDTKNHLKGFLDSLDEKKWPKLLEYKEMQIA